MKYSERRIQRQRWISFGEKIYNKQKIDEFIEFYELNKQDIKKNIQNESYVPNTIKMKKIGQKKVIDMDI